MQSYQFIKNLNDLYKPPLNQGQQPFYGQFLGDYSDNQLDELWDIVMDGHCRTSPPTIGELKKFAKEVTPIKIVNSEQQEAIKSLTEEDIFSTRLGRFSLKQGWASSYLITCQESGVPLQGDDVLLKFQQGKSDADTEAFYLEGKEDLFARAWLRLRKSMNEKNKYWKDKYQHLIDTNVAIAAPL